MKHTRTRYVAVKDNRTRILIEGNPPTFAFGRWVPLEEGVESLWRNIDKIGNARVRSWDTANKAKAALKKTAWMAEFMNYEIVPMTETIEI